MWCDANLRQMLLVLTNRFCFLLISLLVSVLGGGFFSFFSLLFLFCFNNFFLLLGAGRRAGGFSCFRPTRLTIRLV
ncbi:hypothetical protein GGR58DRAFT_97725 [Xylaria digitata]|nr:hypothetical protein GGR58DRAFT_97725 [Xylaria digitata]